MVLGLCSEGLSPQKTPVATGRFPTAAPAFLNMQVVSTNFAKKLVCKCEYYVILWRHKQRVYSNNNHYTPLFNTRFWLGGIQSSSRPGHHQTSHATVLQQSEGWHRPVCLLPAHTERNRWHEMKPYYVRKYNTLGSMHVMSPVLHTWINRKKGSWINGKKGSFFWK